VKNVNKITCLGSRLLEGKIEFNDSNGNCYLARHEIENNIATKVLIDIGTILSSDWAGKTVSILVVDMEVKESKK
jgi:hypothetical protein